MRAGWERCRCSPRTCITEPLVADDGAITLRDAVADEGLLEQYAAPSERREWWLARLRRAYAALPAQRLLSPAFQQRFLTSCGFRDASSAPAGFPATRPHRVPSSPDLHLSVGFRLAFADRVAVPHLNPWKVSLPCLKSPDASSHCCPCSATPKASAALSPARSSATTPARATSATRAPTATSATLPPPRCPAAPPWASAPPVPSPSYSAVP